MKRILYLGYYLKNTDWKKFLLSYNYVVKTQKASRLYLLYDVFVSSWIYKISFLEYFQFYFFESDKSKKKSYAGTAYMYEYQLLMNPPKSREILNDKVLFYQKYKSLVRHKTIDINTISKSPSVAEPLIYNNSGKIVFKQADGKCGMQVKIRKSSDFEITQLESYMKDNNYDILEEFIIQHPAIMKLSPSAVNTVRIFTQLNKDNEVEILGCRMRISINSNVDNLAAGNIAAPIDDNTGIITGPGVYNDITKPVERIHPVTGTPIVGFQIPFWNETIELVKTAAKLHPENRSIGWDIAITSSGPDLIEGNHDWCKLVWQLPVKQGLKPMIEKHRIECRK